MLGRKASLKLYGEYTLCMQQFLKSLKDSNLGVIDNNNDSLSGTYIITKHGSEVAKVIWNIPYLIEFEPLIEQYEKAFSVDYVKSIGDWKQFLNDIERSVTSL